MRALILSILIICPILFKPRVMYAAYDNECQEFLEVVKAGLERNNIKAAVMQRTSPVVVASYTDKWAIAVSEEAPTTPPDNIRLHLLGTCKAGDRVLTISYIKKIKRG